MVITNTPTTAFEKISMDIVGPLPESKYGDIYILTIQDDFTKYSSAIPLPNQQASTIADSFVRKFIFIAPPLKIRFSVPVERIETTIFKPRVESRCFNPLHSYSQSDSQKSFYEK